MKMKMKKKKRKNRVNPVEQRILAKPQFPPICFALWLWESVTSALFNALKNVIGSKLKLTSIRK